LHRDINSSVANEVFVDIPQLTSGVHTTGLLCRRTHLRINL
jgi:hypothetical protein